MHFENPPATACWQHRGLRSGFEVAYFIPGPQGLSVKGTSTGMQDDETFVVSYRLDLDSNWTTRRARIATTTAERSVELRVESDSTGHWLVDGVIAGHLDGCRDVDLEASAFTNALPVHRLNLGVGDRSAAPAAYVRLASNVERLEQAYKCIDDEHAHQRFAYEAPVFDFSCTLIYDRHGLVLDYLGIATRRG